MPNIRPFADILREIEHGHLLDDLAEAQHDIIDGVLESGKMGQLTMVIKYKLETPGQLSVTSDIKAKVPELSRGVTLFFITPEGNLLRDNPKQQGLELKVTPEEQRQTPKQVS